MILLVEQYIPNDEVRLAELNATAAENERLGVFEEFLPLMNSGDRLRYGQAFRMCADRYPGRVCVLANADIRFDETARLLPFAVKSKRLVTLTRWESDATPRMIGHYVNERFYSGSQDVWAFVGGELVGIGDSIPLGYIGCDQAILGEAMLAGYEVLNPALSVKTLHNHASGQRESDGRSVRGTYAYPELTTMHMTGSLMHHPWPMEDDNAQRDA